MDELSIVADLTHASPTLIDDVLARTSRPVVVSHTGVRGTCDNQRNLDDVRHAVNVAGVDHVALGSDWDGAVATMIDASQTGYLIQALLDAGFSEMEVRKIMGGNVTRVLLAALPSGHPHFEERRPGVGGPRWPLGATGGNLGA